MKASYLKTMHLLVKSASKALCRVRRIHQMTIMPSKCAIYAPKDKGSLPHFHTDKFAKVFYEFLAIG